MSESKPAELKTEIYDNISKLLLDGAGVISVLEDGTIEGANSVTKSGNTLTFGGGSGSSMTFINGGSVMNTSGYGTNITQSVGGFTTWTSGGTTYNVFRTGGFSSKSKGSNIAVINGRTVDLNRLDEIAVNPSETKEKVIYKLGQNCWISDVSIKESNSLRELPSQYTNTNFTVKIAGSGSVSLSSINYKSLNINIAGSGSVEGSGGTTTDFANINIAGSGDVNDLTILDSGNVCMMGSGDVKISARNPSRINKSKMGSGSIRITQG